MTNVPHNCEQCDDIKKLLAVMPTYVKRLEKAEDRLDSTDKTVSELVTSNAETKVYVKLILDKLDGMEGNLFNYVKQAMSDATTERMAERQLDHVERKEGSQERITTTGQFTGLIKYVIGATIGALIAGVGAYLKLKGGS